MFESIENHLREMAKRMIDIIMNPLWIFLDVEMFYT